MKKASMAAGAIDGLLVGALEICAALPEEEELDDPRKKAVDETPVRASR